MAHLCGHRTSSLDRQRAFDLGLVRACPCFAAHHACVRTADCLRASVWAAESDWMIEF